MAHSIASGRNGDGRIALLFMKTNFQGLLLSIAGFTLLIMLAILFFVPPLFNCAFIALSLGLRHGLDADHIMAIDNVTRKLTFEKKSSRNTGLFFALGHSTIVFFLTLMLVVGIQHSEALYTHLKDMGDRIGALISIAFLIFTLILNLNFKKTTVSKIGFQIIDRPQKMYIIGFLFGLGFDTATEIGLLSLAAASLIQGFSLTLILLLPLLFAGGMIITDTLNSSFMTRLYTQINQNQQALKTYYDFILGFTSLATVFVIGIEIFNYLKKYTIISNQLENANNLGVVIVLIFIVSSLLIYKKRVRYD